MKEGCLIKERAQMSRLATDGRVAPVQPRGPRLPSPFPPRPPPCLSSFRSRACPGGGGGGDGM